MQWHVVLIDWAGPVPFGEQMLALRNIASIYLRRGTYDKKVNFTHLLIEGKLTYRGPMAFGSLAGKRFFVDLGTHNAAPWYCEFLLLRHEEEIDEDSVIFQGLLDENEEYAIKQVDVAQGRASEDNIT